MDPVATDPVATDPVAVTPESAAPGLTPVSEEGTLIEPMAARTPDDQSRPSLRLAPPENRALRALSVGYCTYEVGSDGTITVPPEDVPALLALGCTIALDPTQRPRP